MIILKEEDIEVSPPLADNKLLHTCSTEMYARFHTIRHRLFVMSMLIDETNCFWYCNLLWWRDYYYHFFTYIHVLFSINVFKRKLHLNNYAIPRFRLESIIKYLHLDETQMYTRDSCT